MEDLLNSFVNKERDLQKVFEDEHFAQAILDVFDGKESKEVLKRYVDYEYMMSKVSDGSTSYTIQVEDYKTFIDCYEEHNMLDIISYFGILKCHHLLFQRFIDDTKGFIKIYCNKHLFCETFLNENLFQHYKIDVKKLCEEKNLTFYDVYQMFRGRISGINEFCSLAGIPTKDSWKKGLPYNCEYCSESFRNEYAFSLHLKENHKDHKTIA